MRRIRARALVALLAVGTLVAGCGSAAAPPSSLPGTPSASTAPSATASAQPTAPTLPTPTPVPETPPATAAPTPTSRPVVVRPVPPSALPVRATAYLMGRSIQMAPQGDGGLYVAIPDDEGTLLVALDDNLRVRPGWPLLIEGGWCEIAADVADGSMRAVCGAEVLGFDRDGRSLDGWPVRLPQQADYGAGLRVIEGDLYLVADTWNVESDTASASLANVLIVRVAREGTVETGTAVTTDPAAFETAISLGPDGTGYILHYLGSAPIPPYVTIRAFDLEGMRPGWPIQFDGPSVSSPGFGRDGKVSFVQGESDWQGEIDAPSRLHSVDRQGRTMWTVELPVAVSPEWTGAASFDVPAPPAAGSRGTAFVVTDQHHGDRTVVYAVDPSGDVTGRWSSPVGLAYAGFCGLQSASGAGCSTGCGQIRVEPVVDGADTLTFALEDGRVMALSADGRTRAGWPVTLRRPGAAFWSLATDADGTAFALAIEPEPGAYDTPECGYPPASATILAIAPDGSVRARATVVEP